MRIIPTLGIAARCPHFIGLSAIRACGRLMQVKMSRTRTHARRGKTEAATALVADACNWDGVVFASSATGENNNVSCDCCAAHSRGAQASSAP